MKSFQILCILYYEKSNLIDVIENKMYIGTQKGIIIFDLDKYVIQKEVLNELVVQIRYNMLLCVSTDNKFI